jgi:alpha-N-acetylglucosaminidase
LLYKPFIWTKLHNFGDTSGIRGDLHQINSNFPFQALDAKSSIIGIGATPEGIDQNPIYYDFLYANNFRSAPFDNLEEHIIQTNHKRYGLHSREDDNVSKAWKLLLESWYAQDFSVQDRTGVAHMNPIPSSSLFEDDRYTPKPVVCKIFRAWEQILHAAKTVDPMNFTDLFHYDLVNVGREVMAQLTTPMALNFSDARNGAQMNPTHLLQTGTQYMQLLLDLDKLLETNNAFSLQWWLDAARKLARDDASGKIQQDCFSPILQDPTGNCEDFYEWNARCQVTSKFCFVTTSLHCVVTTSLDCVHYLSYEALFPHICFCS